MKILHINSYFNGSLFFKNLYDSQRRKKMDFDVFIPVSKPVSNPEVFGEYSVVSQNHTRFDRLFFKVKHEKIYKDIQGKLDLSSYTVTHAHSLFSNGLIAMRLKKAYGIPYIVAVRNTDVFTFFQKMIHLRKLGIRIMQEAEQVIFLSPAYRSHVIRHYVPAALQEEIWEKSRVIPNGIDRFWFEHRQRCPKRIHTNPLRLLYVGVINENKNISATVQAMEILKTEGISAELTAVGKIRDQKVFQALKSSPLVQFKAPVRQEELLQIYRNHDIFVMPSRHESFGLVYAEAMSQGLPVIYSKGQGFDGQFKDGEVGFAVDPTDPKDLADKIRRIREDFERLQVSAQSNLSKFDWDTIAETYSDIYRSVEPWKNL